MKLKDKVAVITGASSGIGQGIAVHFAEEGARVAAVGRNYSRLKETEEQIKKAGGECLLIQADLYEFSHYEMIIRTAEEHFGRIDILVNSAGIFELDDFENIDESAYDRTVTLNTKAQFFLAQHASRAMKKQGKGKIVNIASQGGGAIGVPRASTYCLSKGAVVAMTQTLAVELGPANINVNAISPGTILTPINEEIIKKDPSFLKAETEGAPLGRVGRVRDISSTAVFLASDDSDLITGIQIVADGGFSAQ